MGKVRDVFRGRLGVDREEDGPYEWTEFVLFSQYSERRVCTIPLEVVGSPVVKIWCLSSSIFGASV
jgi:hypothetical protein